VTAIPARLSYLVVFIAVIGHASSEFLSVLSGVRGPEVSVWRYTLGSLGLVMLALMHPATRDLLTPLRERPWRLTALGLVGISVTYLAFHWSLDFATVVQVGTTVTTMPIFIGIINQLVNGERLTPAKMISGACAVTGIAVLLTDGYLALLAGSGKQLIGIGLTLVCAAFGSAYAVLARPLINHYGAIRITTITLSIGGVGLWLVVGMAWGKWINPGSLLSLPATAAWSLLVLAIFNTTITQILFFGGLAAAPDITRAGYIFFLKPVIAAFLAFVFLSQPITALQLAAILVVCGSVAGEALASQYFARPAP